MYRRKKPRSRKIYNFQFILISIPVILFSYFFYSNHLFNKRAYLAVPVTSKTYFPPVLFFPHISFNVLGSQAIAPTDIVRYVNIERNKRGEQSLVINEKLTAAARLRAEVILKHQNFSHQDPFEGIELTTVLPKVGYYFTYASENIGMGGISGEDFVKGFMNSTSHRLNLLNPDLYHTGVHVVTGPYKQYYVNIAVQLFAIPADKNEYLGYNETDKKNYRNLLTNYNLQLNPVILTVSKIVNKDTSGSVKINNIKRQKEILTELFARMNEEKPFEEKQANLIKEYNGYL